MADIKWIKITTDIFDDEKILLIESMPERDSLIVIWFKLLCMAGRQNNGGVFTLNDKIAYTDEMLATIFRRPLNTVRLALSTFEAYGMIDIVQGTITIPKWEKHQSIDQMEKIKAQTRERVAAFRERQKAIAGSNATRNVTPGVTVTQRNATDKEEEIEEEREREEENKLYGGDDARGRAENTDPYKFLESDVSAFFLKYFNRPANAYDQEQIRECIAFMHQVAGSPPPPFRYEEDERELLEIAFQSAAKAGCPNVGYIDGVFRNYWRRGIHTVDEYYYQEVKRDGAVK